ncbi:hypothetical protein JGU66_22890 [Myxococcaceae bacterium JPH2]|nr:hypothetical protein [Myxococcaceae bacterium JPH2]
MNDCPFCRIAGHERVLLTTPGARVMCDARPALAGHLLVVSETHVPSAEDLSAWEYQCFRRAQQEIAARVHAVFGEVGVYEHGRSAICRFHCADRGDTHGHAHVVPVSCDLIERTGFTTRLGYRPPVDQLVETDRYVYQEAGATPESIWGFGGGNVRRHFVRSELHRVLEERGARWVPLDAPPTEHREANEESVRLLSTPTTRTDACIQLAGESSAIREEAARTLATRLGWALVRPEAVLRLAARHEAASPGKSLGAALESLLRAVEQGTVRFGPEGLAEQVAPAPTPAMLAREAQLASDPVAWERLGDVLRAVLRARPSVFVGLGAHGSRGVPGTGLVVHVSESAARPSGTPWSERHLDTTSLTPEQIAEWVAEAWALRHDAATPERLSVTG